MKIGNILKIGMRLFGLLLFIFILLRINLTETVSMILNSNLTYILSAILLCSGLLLFVRAWRWQYLMNMQDITYSLMDSALIYAAASYIATLTPGRVGDFIKVLYIQQEGHSFGKSFVSVFMDRTFDLISLIIIGYICMFVFVILFKEQIIILSVLFIIITIFLIFLIFNKKSSKNILRKMYAIFIPERYKTKVKINFDDFYKDLCSLKTYRLSLVAIATIIGWVIYFIAMYLLALSIDINIPFFYLATCVSISAVITLIPISISGIGTRDATLIILFSYVGLSKESAIAFSMMILFMHAVNASIGLVAWLKKPVNITSKEREKLKYHQIFR